MRPNIANAFRSRKICYAYIGSPAVFLNPELLDCLRPNPEIFGSEKLIHAYIIFSIQKNDTFAINSNKVATVPQQPSRTYLEMC